MVDIHCHILPGVDDGAKDWPTTFEMCRIAYEDGIRHIVATPHANNWYSYSREQHQASLNELQARVPELTFTLGCDFNVSYENVEALRRNPHEYAIGNSRFLLAELSDYGVPIHLKDYIFQIHCLGLTTVITHPERNAICAQYPEFAAELVGMGCLLQITGGSLLGSWGRGARKLAERYLAQGLVSVIASDAHEARRRAPVLAKARKAAAKIIGNESASLLVEANPHFILGDGETNAAHAPMPPGR
jgi:protein-tyrosine phosphatase